MAFVCIPPLVSVDQSLPIAGFDIDHTLIKPKSKNTTFPNNKDDWTWLYNCREIEADINLLMKKGDPIRDSIIIKRLIQLHKDSYRVIAYTNQGGSKFVLDDFKYKIGNMQRYIPFLEVRISTEKDNYRKPNTGMWLDTDNKIGSFYVGDAAGRQEDHASSDLYFARNVGIDFHTPEEFFLGRKVHRPRCKEIPMLEGQHLICLVGYPGAGKSYFSKSLLVNDDGSINNKLVIVGDDNSSDVVLSGLKKALDEGKSVIIDRLNGSITDRKIWIDIAKKYNISIRCFHIATTMCMAQYFNDVRDKHIDKIVYYKYRKYYNRPSVKEGFTDVYKVYDNRIHTL